MLSQNNTLNVAPTLKAHKDTTFVLATVQNYKLIDPSDSVLVTR